MVEGQSVLAPGSLLPPGRLIPRGQLWAGCPAQYVRDLSADEVRRLATGGQLTAVTLHSTCQAAATAAATAAAAAAQQQQQRQEELQWPQLSQSPPCLQQMLEAA